MTLKNRIIEVITNKYPHLRGGVLEYVSIEYIKYIAKIVIYLTGTFLILLTILAIFNNLLNITNGDKKAARKFWTALLKNF